MSNFSLDEYQKLITFYNDVLCFVIDVVEFYIYGLIDVKLGYILLLL